MLYTLIHSRGDELWYSHGIDLPKREHDVDGYIAALIQAKPVRIRMIGSRSNASLICRLHEQVVIPRHGVIDLVSPRVCHSRDELDDPTTAIIRMRACRLPGSLGGWHEMRPIETPHYKLPQLIDSEAFGEHANHVLRSHPAWAAASFVYGLNPEYLASVLSFAIDPRWFVIRQHPNRASRFTRKFSINHSTLMAVMSRTDNELTTRQARCRDMLYCWYREKDELQRGDAERPGSFLLRKLQHHGGLHGMFDATKAFATYLFHTWRHALLSHTGQEFFLPEYFFKDRNELSAYRDHIESTRDS